MEQTYVNRILITSPGDCVFGCCFPLSREDFFERYNLREEDDFLSSQLKNYLHMDTEHLWSDIYSDFATKISKAVNDIEKMGVRVIRNFSSQDIASVNKYRVFTLFAHFSKKRQQIEFADGLHDKTIFAERVDKGFSGMFDLTACNSVEIRNHFKKIFPDVQVISFNIEIPIITLMLIYKQVILNLSRNEINYIDCYLQTIKDLNK
jgi:hypothetical protein